MIDYSIIHYNTKAARQVLPFLIEWFNPKSILDIGCGLGTWLKVAKELTVELILGIDDISPKTANFLLLETEYLQYDISKPIDLGKTFDLVVSLEVAEHVAETFSDPYIDNLTRHSDVILFSAAIPFQGGDGHINEQWPQYWANKFHLRGYSTYDVLRQHIWENQEVDWWYRQNIFLAIREKYSQCHPIVKEWGCDLTIKSLIHPCLYLDKETQSVRKVSNRCLIRELLSRLFHLRR